MGFFDNWPYTDFHRLNLDWILEEIKKNGATVEQLRQIIEDPSHSLIHFADPLEWSGGRTYLKFTIVSYQGSSYMARRDVPVDTPLSNAVYWAKVADYNAQIEHYINEVEALKKQWKAYETVSEMAAEENMAEGMYCHTNGFHSSGDGGAAFYTVTRSATANGFDHIQCQNNLVAVLTYEDHMSPEQFGAYGDGTHDDTAAFTRALEVRSLSLTPGKTYLIDNIEVNNRSIYGNSATLKTKTTYALTITNSTRMETFQGFHINANTHSGIHVKTSNGGVFTDIMVDNIAGYGVLVDALVHSLIFQNCSVMSSSPDSHLGTGFRCLTSDCTFENCSTANCTVGFHSTGWNIFNNCHPWVGHDYSKLGSAGFEFKYGEVFTNCYPDSVQYAYKLLASGSTAQISNTHWLVNDTKNEGFTSYLFYTDTTSNGRTVNIDGVDIQNISGAYQWLKQGMQPHISGFHSGQELNTIQHTAGAGVTENTFTANYFNGGVSTVSDITVAGNLPYGSNIFTFTAYPQARANGVGFAVNKTTGEVENISGSTNAVTAGVAGIPAGNYFVYYTLYY